MFIKMLLVSFLSGGVALAEEKTCAVKGMHCDGCVEMVQGKVCDEGKFASCEVKIIDMKKEMGQIHIITKDKTEKVDQAKVKSAVKDAGYTLQSCASGSPKAVKEPKKAKG